MELGFWLSDETSSRDQMSTAHKRISHIEDMARFRHWVRLQRMFEFMSVEELEVLARTGQWPERPEPALGSSCLDSMNHKRLIRLWKKHTQEFAGRTSTELEFY